MKVLGKRDDGVVLVDVGTGTAFAINPVESDPGQSRFANLGDPERVAGNPEWKPVSRADAIPLQPVLRKAFDRGRLVQPDQV